MDQREFWKLSDSKSQASLFSVSIVVVQGQHIGSSLWAVHWLLILSDAGVMGSASSCAGLEGHLFLALTMYLHIEWVRECMCACVCKAMRFICLFWLLENISMWIWSAYSFQGTRGYSQTKRRQWGDLLEGSSAHQHCELSKSVLWQDCRCCMEALVGQSMNFVLLLHGLIVGFPWFSGFDWRCGQFGWWV